MLFSRTPPLVFPVPRQHHGQVAVWAHADPGQVLHADLVLQEDQLLEAPQLLLVRVSRAIRDLVTAAAGFRCC